jgi:hypothetical protein
MILELIGTVHSSSVLAVPAQCKHMEDICLPGQRQRLLKQLDRLSLQLRGLDKVDYLDMDHLSLAGDPVHDQATLRPSKPSPDAIDLDVNYLSNAKTQLDLYNKRWKEIQAHFAKSSTALSPSIPWPELSPTHNNSFRTHLKIRDKTTPTLVWRWATYSFFVSVWFSASIRTRCE